MEGEGSQMRASVGSPAASSLKLSAESVESITGSALGSPGFRGFAFVMSALILVSPTLLVLSGIVSGPADNGRVPKIVWGAVLAVLGLATLGLMAAHRTSVTWASLKRGFTGGWITSQVPWERVRGIVVEPGQRNRRHARLWVIYSTTTESMAAKLVPNGLCQSSIEDAQASADRLNGELGVTEPSGLFQAIRAQRPFNLTQGWTYLLLGFLALLTFGFGLPIALFLKAITTMARSTWLLTVATFDLVILGWCAAAAAQSHSSTAGMGSLMIVAIYLGTPLLFLVLAVRSWSAGRAKNGRLAS